MFYYFLFNSTKLCRLLYKHYGFKAVVLLDEYDTPLQEAWLNHYWDEAVPFVRQFMNATFKDNEYEWTSPL